MRPGHVIALMVIVGLSVAGCGRSGSGAPGRTSGGDTSGTQTSTAAPRASAGHRVRTGDLPTLSEVAAIYAELRGGARDVYPLEAEEFDETDCGWAPPLAATSGRWASYDGEDEQLYFSGGESVNVAVAGFDSVTDAKAAIDAFQAYVERCAGHHEQASDDQFTLKKFDLEDGLVGVGEFRITPNSITVTTESRSATILARAGALVVRVSLQKESEMPDLARGTRLAHLARDVAGRARQVPEPVPAGAKLSDLSDVSAFVSATGSMDPAVERLPEPFRDYVKAEAASLTQPSDDAEWVMEDCTVGLHVVAFRSDGFARLRGEDCIGDGPDIGFFAAQTDGTWAAVGEHYADGSGYGSCAALSAVQFPSSIAGSWCYAKDDAGRDYPLN